MLDTSARYGEQTDHTIVSYPVPHRNARENGFFFQG